MARALLINPSTSRTYGANLGRTAFPVFPVMSLAALAGAVRDRGHEVRILDLSYLAYDPGLIRQVLRSERPDVVGVTCTTPLVNQARDISYIVRDELPGARTIVGGSHPSALPHQTMKESAFDFVATGEADFVVADLLDDRDPADVQGLWHRVDGEILRSDVKGQLLEDLDDLPMPGWEHYPMDVMAHVSQIVARRRPMTVAEFSRGCIYGCDFCASKNTLGRGYRKKSPERIVAELERLAHRGIHEVLLVDDIFTTDRNWSAAVCEAIIRSGLDVAWTCSNGIRVDSADPELFDLMKRAGCYRVYFGFESGSDEVLKAFGKGGRTSVAKAVEAVNLARRAGLEASGFFQVGLTGDTAETMQATVDFASRIPLDTMKCGMTVPFPGTPMFHELHRQGRMKVFEWDSYTVYNKIDEIFDHPSLTPDEVHNAFRRFYVKAMIGNPAYLWRRFRFMLRNKEIAVTIKTVGRFAFLIWGRGKSPDEENYEYEATWRPLDLKLGEPVDETVPIIPRRRSYLTIGPRSGDRTSSAAVAVQD